MKLTVVEKNLLSWTAVHIHFGKPESRGSVTSLGLLASEGRPVEQDVSSLAGFIPRV